MNFFKKAIFLLLLFVLIIFLPAQNRATPVIDNSNTTETLRVKWNKALSTGLKQNKSFWLVYSVDRLMAENSYFIAGAKINGHINTSSFSSTFHTSDGIPLGKLLYGKNAKILKPKLKSEKEQVKEAAENAIARIKNKSRKYNYKKVKKEVAMLFLFEPGMDKSLVKIRYSNMFFPFESQGNPIYWLGKTDENNSLKLVKSLFSDPNNSDKAKRYLLSAIGNHSDSRQVIPFLEKVVNSDEADKVRSKAASELGDQDNPSAIDILLNTAKNDHSLEVRRKAVNALEDLDFKAAVDALINIAKTANNTYIRQKAINCLGDVGSQSAADALNSIAFKDSDMKVQRKAVNALEDLPNNSGVSYLINIAKTHPKPYIRKKALNCLSDIKDSRAFEAIKAIAKEKR